MLSILAWYNIPAYASGFGHAQANWPIALGGIRIRVHPDTIEEARQLLAEVATRAQATRPRTIENPVMRVIVYAVALFLCPLPTRVGSTFFLDDPDRPSESEE